ncbi:MAG: trimeric autotransporter adhesin [Acidimicrobiaceae bacterium]
MWFENPVEGSVTRRRRSRSITVLVSLTLVLGSLFAGSVPASAATTPVISTVLGGLCSPNAIAMGLEPSAVVPDGAGGFYVSDNTHSIVCGVAADGTTRLVAGNGAAGKYGDAIAPYGDGGDARHASLYTPSGLAVDNSGNLLIADRWNQRIRKVDHATGVLSTVAGNGVAGFSGDGGAATAAQLNFPTGLVVDSSGNIYIADNKNHRIRRVTSSGTITTIAGTGTAAGTGDGGNATAATLNLPSDLAVRGSSLYISDAGNNKIRRVDLTTSVITTFAGTGTAGYKGDGGQASAAALNYPLGVAVDNQGTVYVADSGNQRVRSIRNGVISTYMGTGAAGFSGDGGRPANAALNFPVSVSLDGNRNVYVADQGNRRVRMVTTSANRTSTVAGNGTLGYSGDNGLASAAQLNQPTAVAWTKDGRLLVADAHDNEVRAVRPDGVVVAVAGTPGVSGFSGDGGAATNATLGFLSGVAADGQGNIFVADWNNRVRKIAASTGVITTIAGNGTAGFGGDGGEARSAMFNRPSGLVFDTAGDLLVTDTGNNRVRRLSAVNGDVSATSTITTIAGNGIQAFAGDGGPAAAASLSGPVTVAVDASNNVYVADAGNQRIRRVLAATGQIETVAGSGVVGYSPEGQNAKQSALNYPRGVAIDGAGNLFIADTGNCIIRKVNAPGSPTSTMITTAGWTPLRGVTPVCGFAGENASPRTGSTIMSDPSSLTFDPAGNLYVADSLTHRVRKITPG